MNKRVKLDLLPQVLQVIGRNEPALRHLFSFWGLSREELLNISTSSTEFRDLTIRNNFFWYVLAKHYQLINENDPYNFKTDYKLYVIPNMPLLPLLGVVYACGSGSFGVLGDGIFEYHNVGIPTIIPNLQNITMISAGRFHSLFLTQDGMVHACGYGLYGRLGDERTDHHNVGIPTVIPNLQNVIMISAGDRYSLFLTQDGKVHACGSGQYGCLGDGIIISHVVGTPTVIPNLQDVIMISAGVLHSLFLTQDGKVHACGNGRYGKLGNGRIDDHNVGIPTIIPNLQNVTMIYAGANHSLFLTQDGMVHACGNGKYGQLGDGRTDDHDIGIPTMIHKLRNVTMISAGYEHSLFLTQDGMVHACGNGNYGQFGDEISDDHNVVIPTVILNLQNIIMISAGVNNSLFLTQNEEEGL